MIRSTRRLGFSFALAAALLLPGSASAEHHEGEAAERAVVLGEKITRHGKVVSIDAKARTVTVEGEQGQQVSIVAPEPAPNFDKIKVGDPVVATYYESVALAIAPVADAEPGLSGAQLRAVVKAVDPEARSVTLDVPEGGERTLKAGEAIDLEKVKVGEQVSVTLTRALAISIDRK
jgi:Cu/Ag efflux protein CusF